MVRKAAVALAVVSASLVALATRRDVWYTQHHIASRAARHEHVAHDNSTTSTTDDSLQMLWRCARYMDEYCSWRVDTDTFAAVATAMHTHTPPPQHADVACSDKETTAHATSRLASRRVSMQLLRLHDDFVLDTDDDDNNSGSDDTATRVPVARVVAFLPGATTRRVHAHLTDLDLRRQWDGNYQLYSRFEPKDEDGDKAPALLLQRVPYPLQDCADATHDTQCALTTQLPLMTTLQSHGWFCHRVGSALLNRLGVQSRFFAYERATHVCAAAAAAAASADEDGNDASTTPARVYSILYYGPRDHVTTAAAASRRFAAWLDAAQGSDAAVAVDMYYQHIWLLPIAHYSEQVYGARAAAAGLLQRAAHGGSFASQAVQEVVCHLLRDTHRRYAEHTATEPGTLLVMTSVNDIGVPRTMPQWLQRRVTRSVAQYAYDKLLAALQ